MITTYCKSFLKSDNPILVELLPKKPLQSLITVVTLLSYSTINFDKFSGKKILREVNQKFSRIKVLL